MYIVFLNFGNGLKMRKGGVRYSLVRLLRKISNELLLLNTYLPVTSLSIYISL